jgi:hypothetical protein
MKKIVSILLIALVFTAAIFWIPKSAAADTYVTLDINPSVELIVSPRERVIYANALNEDGEVLLGELNVIGLKLDVAMQLIIDTAIELGFIDAEDEETLVDVSVISNNNQIGEMIRTRIKDQINQRFNDRAINGGARDKTDDNYQPAFVLEARSYGVTPGFLFLAQKAVFMDDSLTLDVALEMEVGELQAIVKAQFENKRDIIITLKDEFLATRAEIKAVYQPQLEALMLEIEALEAALENETDEALRAEMEAELTLLLDEHEALRVAFKAELETLRDSFVEQSKTLRLQIRNFILSLRNRHQVIRP